MECDLKVLDVFKGKNDLLEVQVFCNDIFSVSSVNNVSLIIS